MSLRRRSFKFAALAGILGMISVDFVLAAVSRWLPGYAFLNLDAPSDLNTPLLEFPQWQVLRWVFFRGLVSFWLSLGHTPLFDKVRQEESHERRLNQLPALLPFDSGTWIPVAKVASNV